MYVHATYSHFYLLYVNGNAKNVVFVVKRYAVREAKNWRYAVRKAKIGQYAVHKGGGVSPPTIDDCCATFMILV